VPPQLVYMSDMTGAGFRRWTPANVGALLNPQGFDIDANGHIFIADTGNHRIVEIDDFTPPSFTGADEAAFGTQGANTNQLNGPADVAVSRDGLTLLIADTLNNRLVKLNHPTTFAMLGGTGWGTLRVGTDFTTAWNQPGGVAYGSDGKIYVTDTRNHRLVRMDDFNGTNLVSFGLDGSGTNQFVKPYGLFVR
jgi:DNA-binding beta-propeller fold protein YncE